MHRLQPGSSRDFVEVILGYGIITAALWTPLVASRILSLVALALTFLVVWAHRRIDGQSGFGWSGLIPSLWILPAAALFAGLSMLMAWRIGTLHPLYDRDFAHVAGYVLWTIYQQFLLNVYFRPRLERLLASEAAAVGLTAVLFSAAHLPNFPLTAATLVWGFASCILYVRYGNIYTIGLAQGLLGICFAVCVPDALHHHMRVGLGFLHYQATHP